MAAAAAGETARNRVGQAAARPKAGLPDLVGVQRANCPWDTSPERRDRKTSEIPVCITIMDRSNILATALVQ